MDKLDLVWETFEFHTVNLADLEVQHINNIKQYKALKKSLNPSQRYKLYLKKKLIRHFNKLIYEYNKYIFSIEDIIKIHHYRELNGIKIPEIREIPLSQLYELKNVTATQCEEVKVWKQEVLDVLN